jgi:repressor LexA
MMKDSQTPTKEVNSLSVALRRRMKDLSLSQADIADFVGKSQAWVSQYLFRNAERTLLKIYADDINAYKEIVTGLGRVLNWTPEEFYRNTGFKLPGVSLLDSVIAQPDEDDPWELAFQNNEVARLQPYSHNQIDVFVYRIPIVDAGAGLPKWNDLDERIVIALPELKGKTEHQLFAVRVCGDSMSGYAEDGQVVIFDTEKEVMRGAIVAVHYPDDGLVVKRFLGISSENRLLLGNENRDGYDPVFDAPEGAQIRGVSIGTWKPD